MSSPYVGEIRMFGGNFAPVGWMLCEGQLLPISEYDVLFNLIGTTYGGDGQSTFGLPDLRGRLPMHQGNGFTLGEIGGVESVTLTISQMPSHNHTALASTGSTAQTLANGNCLSQGPDIYEQNTAGNAAMSPALSPVGGSLPHNNFQPYLCVNFIISFEGVFPSQS